MFISNLVRLRLLPDPADEEGHGDLMGRSVTMSIITIITTAARKGWRPYVSIDDNINNTYYHCGYYD